MLDRKNFSKDSIYNITKHFDFLSKVDIENAKSIIEISYGSIEAHMVIIVVEKDEIIETIYFTEKPKELYKEKDFSNLNLPDGRYLFDVPLGKVVYSYNNNEDIDYNWVSYFVPTRFVETKDDFICKLDGKFYRASMEVVGLAVLKNISYSCLYARNGIATEIGINFIKRNVGIVAVPTWMQTAINYNGKITFDEKQYPYLKKIAQKI